MDAIERFVREAAHFEQWARHGTDQGDAAARAALLHITRLYLAALELPPAPDDAPDSDREPDRVSDEDWQAVLAACARLPFDQYGEVFDPLLMPPEAPVIASLADDIADIYRDVVSGLREYRTGRHTQAVWEWTFLLHAHWGEHATGAIRALHCWLAAGQS